MPDAQSTPAGRFTELLSALKDRESPVYNPKQTTAPTPQATGATQKTTPAPKESPLPPTTVLKKDDPANRDLLERHIGAYGKGQFSNLTWIKTARLVSRMVVRRLHDIPLRTEKMTKLEGAGFPEGGSGMRTMEELQIGKFQFLTFFLF